MAWSSIHVLYVVAHMHISWLHATITYTQALWLPFWMRYQSSVVITMFRAHPFLGAGIFVLSEIGRLVIVLACGLPWGLWCKGTWAVLPPCGSVRDRRETCCRLFRGAAFVAVLLCQLKLWYYDLTARARIRLYVAPFTLSVGEAWWVVLQYHDVTAMLS